MLGSSPLAAVASPPAPARTPRPAAVQSLGAPPPKKAKAVPVPAPGLDLPGGSQERRGGGDSSWRARLAAMEMELEAFKRGSDGGASQVGGAATGELAEALKAQTAAITVLRAVVAKAPSPQSKPTWHGPP